MVASLALIYWQTRNLFSPLLIAAIFIALNFIGCLLIIDFGEPAIRLAFLVAVGIACSALGGLAARRWLRHDPVREKRAFQAKEALSWFASETFFTMTVYAFILLGMGAVMLFFFRAGVPLLSSDVAVARVVAPREGGYLSVRFMRLYLPLLLMIYVVGRRKMVKENRLLAAFTVLFLLVAFTLFGYRGYVLNFFLLPFMLLLAYHRVSKRTVTILGLAGFASAFAVTGILYQESHLSSLWNIISERIFLAEVFEGLGPIVYLLVPKVGFLHGQGFLMDIPAVLSRVGIGPPGIENFSQYLTRFTLGYNFYETSSAPTLIGEAYANFGYPGVVVIMFLFGFLLQSLYIRTLRGPKDAFFLPIMVSVQCSLLVAAHGPLVFVLLDAGGSLLIFATIFVSLYFFWSLPKGGPKFRRHVALPDPQVQPAAPNRPAKKGLYARPRWAWRKP